MFGQQRKMHVLFGEYVFFYLPRLTPNFPEFVIQIFKTIPAAYLQKTNKQELGKTSAQETSNF